MPESDDLPEVEDLPEADDLPEAERTSDSGPGELLAQLLNALPDGQAMSVLMACCGATSWARGMIESRPFVTDEDVLLAAADLWWNLTANDWNEAFGAHPRIGDRSVGSEGWAAAEQSGAAGASFDTIEALATGNAAYEERFGHVFLICATGKSAEEMLEALQGRMTNEPEAELLIAAREQAKITGLRLSKLVQSGP